MEQWPVLFDLLSSCNHRIRYMPELSHYPYLSVYGEVTYGLEAKMCRPT